MKSILRVVIAVALLVCGCSRPEDRKAASSPEQSGQLKDARASDSLLRIGPDMLRDLRVTTSAAEERQGSDGVSLLGEVTINENAFSQVGPPVPARIVTMSASQGQHVVRGQPLAVLQSVDLGRARSENITAQAKLRLAQQTLERKRRLVAERIVAQRDVQEAEAAVASAEAEVKAAHAALQALGAGDEAGDSSLLVLRAPIAGTVIERAGLLGQMAEPAQALFKIAGLNTVWLNVHAFERDAVRLRAGSPARVTLPAWPGQTFPAKVSLVGNIVDPVSRTVSVRIEIANRSGALRPGMSAAALVPFAANAQQIITVPAASVQRIDEDWFVFIPRSPGAFEMRLVGRGRDLEGEIEIVKGLKKGETVVVEGAFLLKAEAEKARSEGKEHDHD